MSQLRSENRHSNRNAEDESAFVMRIFILPDGAKKRRFAIMRILCILRSDGVSRQVKAWRPGRSMKKPVAFVDRGS
jgi:hypothetical protein